MGRGPKPAKAKRATPPGARKSLKNDGAKVRDLEKRLAEALAQVKTRASELAEAREQQTATTEILKAISRSPTSLEPIAQAIADSTGRLCSCAYSAVFRFDGELIHWVAARGATDVQVDALRDVWPRPPGRETLVGRVVLARDTLHIRDAASDPTHAPSLPTARAALAIRSWLGIPILREDKPIGVIVLVRVEVRPFSEQEIALVQTFASQAVIAIENARLFNETTEALEQQTATSEILQVISRSTTDVRPVFEAILSSALRLCDGLHGGIFMVRQGQIVLESLSNVSDEARDAFHRVYPTAIDSGGLLSSAIREGVVVHVPDVATYQRAGTFAAQLGAATGYRCLLVIPLVRDNSSIGALALTRVQPEPFSASQVALVRAFADQAVIAIENVRLFTELQEKNQALTQAHAQVSEALDQQTATAEILRVISQSPTDVQPVFDTIVQSATRLCRAANAGVFLTDGRTLDLPANYGSSSPEALAAARAQYPRPLDRQTTAGVAILTRSVVHVPDIEAPSAAEVYTRRVGRLLGVRSMVAVPMMRKGEVVGSINLSRQEPGRFSDAEVELLKTFADQAVIAIENVRLFKELQTSNSELTAALDTQTATADILSIISRSQTDVQPVFDAIVQSATRLCRAAFSFVFLTEGGTLYHPASYGSTPEVVAAIRALFPRPVDRGTAAGTAILTRSVVHLPDVQEQSAIEVPRHTGQLVGYRSLLSVPMLRQGEALGAITVSRREPGRFSDAEVELLKTFADQAVIAIENVRLFKELRARTEELTRSVGQLTALGEVGRAVSSTLDLETVLSTIVSRAIQLSGTDGGSVYEYDEVTEEFSLRASRDLPEAYVEQVRDARPRKGEGAVGRVAQTRESVQIADISDAAAYESRVRNMLLQIGLRALLAVPLIAEDQLVGALIVMRKRPGTFAAEEVALLQTFATQSALAIQNARLFREIEDKSRQLEVASQHKSEFLANMSHELRTPLNAIIGFSEVLTDRMFGELNEKQEEYLKDIYASGTHLLSLINDILDLSKIEAGRMELELTDFDLPTALDNALMLIRERAGRRSIALNSNVDNRLGQIQGDERKVRQVVLNLLSNAIKFTPEGGRIDVGAVPKDGFVEVSVSDTGVGIAPEDQEAVFEEFRQVGAADKKVEGTGLGLTLCRKFVELHGGRIWVKSQVGAGATFTFTIPVRHRGEEVSSLESGVRS